MKIVIATVLMLVRLPFLLIAQHATLQLHPKNPHYFLYKNNPTILVGSGEHYGAVINLDFNYKKYFETLAKDGLNTTRLFTGAYIEKQGDFGIAKNTLAARDGRLLLPWKRSEVAGFALGGNKFNLAAWEEDYFVRLKDFIEVASKNNVIVEVNLFSSYYGNGWSYSALNPKNNINGTESVASNKVNTLQNGNILRFQKMYVEKIVRELNHFDNLYFEIQNEPWADQTDTVFTRNEYGAADDWRTTIQVVSKLSSQWQAEVAKWIKQTEATMPKKHLISQNVSNFHFPVLNADPNISVFNYHYTLPEVVSENYHLNKVIGFNETGFAGRSDNTYRRQAWRFIMAGGGLFNHLDYSFSTGGENGTDTSYSAPGGGSPQLRKQFGILKKLMESVDFIQLRPNKLVVHGSPGAMTLSLTNNVSRWIIYYEPMTSDKKTIQLTLPAGKYQVQWMDVLSGQIIEKQNVMKVSTLSVPAGSSDKVLIIESLQKRK